MRTIKIAIMAAAVACVSSFSTFAQTAEEVIKKHIDAIGGEAAWKKVNSIKMEGSINYSGTEVPVTVYMKHKKAMKAEFSYAGMTGYTILTDKAGWVYLPFGGQTKPEPMTEDDVKKSQEDLDVQGKLIDYKAKGFTVTFLGKDDVEGTECFKIKVVSPAKKEETMYFDATNFYHIRSTSKVDMNGKEVEMTQTYSNFKKLPEGIVWAMNQDSGNGPMTVKSVEINKTIEDAVFAPKN